MSQLAVLGVESEKPASMAINVSGMPRKRSGRARTAGGDRDPITPNPYLGGRLRIWLKFAVWEGDNDYWANLESAVISIGGLLSGCFGLNNGYLTIYD